MAAEDEKFILTQDGYDNIQHQLELLLASDQRQREVLADAANDKAGGDNDDADVAVEYDARTRKEWLKEKIGHLQFILERAEIYKDPDPDRINVGERVTLWDFEERRQVQFDLISRAEVVTRAVEDTRIKDVADDSPLGQALLGKRVGDVIEVEVPDGRLRYAVRKIEPISAA